MVSVRVSLKIKREVKIFPQKTVTAGKNRFLPELNEKSLNYKKTQHQGAQRKHKVWHENISR